MELPIKVQGIIYRHTPEGDREFLAIRRIPEDGGFWQSVTGTLENGESLENCLLRELVEEVGINKPVRLTEILDQFEWQKGSKTITEYVFGVEVDNAAQITLSSEHDDFKWIKIEEARELFTIQSYIRTYNLLDSFLKNSL